MLKMENIEIVRRDYAEKIINDNQYKLLKPLGQGAFGIVYEIEDLNDKRHYALKMTKQKNDHEKEFELLKTLDSPYLIQLIGDNFNYDGFYCFVIELCKGGSLKEKIENKIKNRDNFDNGDIFKWSTDIINGLYYLHSNKITHRDIKPANILLAITENNKLQAKLADVGLSRKINPDDVLTAGVGSLDYKSPEIRTGNYDFKTDIWSAGCVIYELIALEKFSNSSLAIDKHLNTRIPQRLIKLMKIMLVKEKEKRVNSTELKNILETLKKMTDDAKITFKDLRYNRILPPSKLLNRNKEFIGRKEYLDQIEEAFTKENKQIIILSSFQGTGKSSIANEIAHRFNKRSFNQFVYWMRSDEDNLDEEFRQFALDLEVITEDEKLKMSTEKIVDKIARKIKPRIDLREEFLFIFDNCSSIEKTKEYFNLIIQDSSLTNVKFLITTTVGSPFEDLQSIMGYIEKRSKNIEVKPLNKEESIDFIKFNLKDAMKEDNKLNELINSLDIQDERPVTLIKLIALIKLKLKSTDDLSNLIEELKLNKRPLDAFDTELFENLIAKEEKAWKILKQSSFLDPELSPSNIYIELFEIDVDEFYDAVDVLIKLSLITKEEDDEMEYGIRIHRTLQNEAKKFLELKYENEYEEILEKQIERIKIILENKIETNQWNKLKYYNNFKQIVDNNLNKKKLDDNNKPEICKKFAQYSIDTNLRIENSLVYFSKSIEIERNIFGTDKHPLIVFTLNNIGLVYDKLGRYEEALKNYSKSLELNRKLFETDKNSSIADTLNNIALVYSKLCKYEEALKNYSLSLEINRKIFRTDQHSSIADTLNNIAGVNFKLDRHEEALENYSKSLEINRKIFKTEEHSSIADNLNNIAMIYHAKGNYETALENYLKSLEIDIKIFGTEEHSSVAKTLNNIGLVYNVLGKHEEALQNYSKSLKIYRKIFGTDEHLDIARTLNNIAGVNDALDRYEEALENYSKSLEINRKIFGTEEHLSIAENLNNISVVYNKLGKHEKALENYLKSLKIKRKIYGTDENLSIARTLNNIADVYSNLSKHKEALENYSKSLEIKQKIFGSDEHLSIANSFIDIGLVFSRLGRLEEAIQNFSKSLKIRQKIFGTDENSSIADSLMVIGLVCNDLGRHEEALQSYSKSLKIYRKIFGTDDHSLIADILNNIAVVYNKLDRHEEALENHFESLKINRKIFKTEEHSSIALTFYNIGLVYTNLGRHEEALQSYSKSLKIYRKIFGTDDHSSIAEAMFKIGDAFSRVFYKSGQQNCFSENNATENKICNGFYLFGNCVSVCKELNSNSIFYKCNICEDVFLVLCKACLDKLENEKYISLNHSHPFKEIFFNYNWHCDGGSIFGRCKSNLDDNADGHKRFNCTICDDFDLCEACLNEPLIEENAND